MPHSNQRPNKDTRRVFTFTHPALTAGGDRKFSRPKPIQIPPGADGGERVSCHALPEKRLTNMQSEAGQIRTRIADVAQRGVDAEFTPQAALATWAEVAAALSPVIGPLGVAALFRRSLYLTQTEFAWLAVAQDGKAGPTSFGDLQAVLAQQSVSTAAAANRALLQTFCDLLIKLVGESLTNRLLRPVWGNPSSGHAVQDTMP
jgi:hypothetical protein